MNTSARKLVILWMTLTISLFWQGCGNDDDAVSPMDVTGDWTITEVEVSAFVNDKPLRRFLIEDANVPAAAAATAEAQATSELRNTLVGVRLDIRSDNTYQTTENDGRQSTGIWELEGNQLITDRGTSSETVYEVRSASESELQLFVVANQRQDLLQNGSEEDVRLDLLWTLTK